MMHNSDINIFILILRIDLLFPTKTPIPPQMKQLCSLFASRYDANRFDYTSSGIKCFINDVIIPERV